MKRIDTSTRELDKHGTGKDGYTNGVVPTTPATQLDATMFDSLQEELATTVERTDQSLVPADLGQVERVISTSTSGVAQYGIISGLEYFAAGGTTANLQPGAFIYQGRRYTLSTADIAALGTETSRTFVVSDTTYVGIRPVGGLIANDTTEVGVSLNGFLDGYCPIAVIRTDGGAIRQNLKQEDALAGPQVDYHTTKSLVITPLQAIGNAGADPGFTPDNPGAYSREHIVQSRTTGASDLVRVPLGPFGVFQNDVGDPAFFPIDTWPNGTVIFVECTVTGQHATENDVNLTEKRVFSTYVDSGSITSATWTNLYTRITATATADGVNTNAGAADSNGFYMEVDSGGLTSGDINWFFHVKVFVATSIETPIIMGDPTDYV